jgi:hypothetical protein
MRPDGRVRLRVEVPVDVAGLVDDLVARSGLDREAVLGDLAAVGLPLLLAELADEAVADDALRRLITIDLPPEEEMPPTLVEGISSESFHDNAEASLPLPGAEPKHPKRQVEGRAVD